MDGGWARDVVGTGSRSVVRGVESGGATADVGYYVSFAGENGEAIPWLQTLDSLTVNGPHAVVIAPVVTRIEMLRIARTYELCITRHRPVAVEVGHRPKLRAEELFRGVQGYLALELWGKDKDLCGCVRPQFFTRAGEEIELPNGFADAVKAVTSGVTCVNCSHPHYSRLVAPPLAAEETEDSDSLHEVAAHDGPRQPAEDVDGILAGVVSAV